MKRIVYGLLTLFVLSATGAHLPILQVAAWAGMIVSRSAQMPVAEALRSTFDGAHPCRMCCAIKKAQAQPEHTVSAMVHVEKIDMAGVELARWLAPHRPCAALRDALVFSSITFPEPSVPPPRG